jgi:thiol peroxidase
MDRRNMARPLKALKKNQMNLMFLVLVLWPMAQACTTTTPSTNLSRPAENANDIEIMFDSAVPGTSVRKGSATIALHKGHLAEGEPFPAISFVGGNLEEVRLDGPGDVRLISIVPSVKTKVCEIQSHRLGEARTIHPRVKRITISRDSTKNLLEFAQKAHLTEVTFLTDNGEFGRRAGLLMTESDLLARAVIVVDTKGVIQYLQVVPDVTRLPDLDGAIAMANGLVTPSAREGSH